MEIQMSEKETELLTRVFNQNQEMGEVLNELKSVIVGDKQYQRPGIIDKISTLEETVKAHDQKDTAQFKEVFDFQNKQALFVGWTGQVIKGLWLIAAVVVGWLISLLK